jgi:predicted CXXCH cytochrome family protein
VWSFQRASIGSSCFACHERAAFPKIHTHNTDILAECQSCHLPHGSAVKGHLKLAKDTACKQCHGQP